VSRPKVSLLATSPTSPTSAHRVRTVPAWLCYLVLGAASASVFLVSDRPWVKAWVQMPVYGVSAALLTWRWWRSRAPSRDPLLTLAVAAFVLYFSASILGALVPLLAPTPTDVPVPSVLDGLFLLSYLLLGLFLWRLGSRSGGAGRRDILDTLIVVGGVAPAFWIFLVAPLFGTGAPLAALVTYVAYPASVFGLFCLTVRLAFVARRRTALHLLLGGWIVGELTADLFFLSATVNKTYVYGQPWQALWIVSATCVGSFALHPRAEVLLERHTLPHVNGPRRLWVLSGCLAAPIVTIFYGEAITDHDFGVMFASVAAFFLVFLLCLRLSGLMVDNAAHLRDQVRMQRLADDLIHQSKHDPLTGLGNRLLFAETADRVLARPATDSRHAPAVLLLDLDDFKLVNDTFGHDAGDRVLVEVTRRLKGVIRSGDESVFRLGGDEFVFLAPQVRLPDALRLAERITAALSEPFELGPRRVRPLACIGISIALNGQDRSALLAEADLAMYAGKACGTSPFVFDPVLHRQTLDREQLGGDLRAAVARRELRVVYQPLVHLASNTIVGVESLLRWDHPTRGTIPPVEFIPLAETNGAILDIGDWVMEESLRQLRRWDKSCPDHRLHISVNVSPRQLNDSEFVARVAEMLSRSALEPSRVTLEITEAVFGADAESMIERLHELKLLGVMLAIDDFGTEYSSLSKLRQLPIDVLKIDKSFVDGIATDPRELALTAAIVNLAASLGKGTVAEGIETEGQYVQLLDLGVEIGQGYLFSRPVSPEAIADLAALAPGRAFQHA
jgi:diguanylate cyclase (GGDEF)-like protein